MPVSMTGNPSPPRAGALNNLPAAYRVVAEAAYAKPEPPSPPKSRTRHFEEVHYAKKWQLDMADESTLGIAPPKWSQTSQMGDTRPNGKSMFGALPHSSPLPTAAAVPSRSDCCCAACHLADARFHNTPMGRARGGHSMVWDSRGVASSGGTTKAVNMDSAFFAADMADEVRLSPPGAQRGSPPGASKAPTPASAAPPCPLTPLPAIARTDKADCSPVPSPPRFARALLGVCSRPRRPRSPRSRRRETSTATTPILTTTRIWCSRRCAAHPLGVQVPPPLPLPCLGRVRWHLDWCRPSCRQPPRHPTAPHISPCILLHRLSTCNPRCRPR